jgi:hypothetical protein
LALENRVTNMGTDGFQSCIALDLLPVRQCVWRYFSVRTLALSHKCTQRETAGLAVAQDPG